MFSALEPNAATLVGVSRETLFITGFALVLGACTADDVSPGDEPIPCEPADRPLICGRKLNIAHRGGGLLAPENTLEAFFNAADLGVDALELDVHATSDGVVVVIHDEEVDRTTDGTGLVKEMTFEALRQLDAGYKFTRDSGATYPFRGRGVVIPTLEEVLSELPGWPLAIEIKQATPRINDAVFTVIDAADAADRAQIASFFDDVLIELRADHPEIATSMGLAEIAEFSAVALEDEAEYVAPARIIQAPKVMVDEAFMTRADRLGVTVHAWTVNTEAEMEALIDLNVNGLMTDDPGLLAGVLE